MFSPSSPQDELTPLSIPSPPPYMCSPSSSYQFSTLPPSNSFLNPCSPLSPPSPQSPSTPYDTHSDPSSHMTPPHLHQDLPSSLSRVNLFSLSSPQDNLTPLPVPGPPPHMFSLSSSDPSSTKSLSSSFLDPCSSLSLPAQQTPSTLHDTDSDTHSHMTPPRSHQDLSSSLSPVNLISAPSPPDNHTPLSWVIHFLSIKYLSIITSLFFTILALQWCSSSPNIKDYLKNYIVVSIQKILPTELDIVKSIVHGGLIQSITSLGVVSCAAAFGISTVNVLALGIANLFTGLILIIHKLYGLITNQPQSHSANNDHVTNLKGETLYKELLGNKGKVKLHCVVVVVSFIFFGLIPPLFYDLSFNKTDKGLYKAVVVLAASLVCVISLSFAKAYAFGMKKRWTVPVYTGMAIGASAFSFIASQFLRDLLEKYDFHELASDYIEG